MFFFVFELPSRFTFDAFLLANTLLSERAGIMRKFKAMMFYWWFGREERQLNWWCLYHQLDDGFVDRDDVWCVWEIGGLRMEFWWVKVMQHVFIASSIKQRKNERVKTTDQKRAKHDQWSLIAQFSFTLSFSLSAFLFRIQHGRLFDFNPKSVYVLCRNLSDVFSCFLKSIAHTSCLPVVPLYVEVFFLSLESLKLKSKIKKIHIHCGFERNRELYEE